MPETATLTEATKAPAVRPLIDLVLGGGGAKGFVHLGVFKAIEQQQLSIASITGTSIGAIWGTLYANAAATTFSGHIDASEKAIKTIEQLAYQSQVRDYLDLNVTSLFRKGLLKGDKFERWLETMLWYHGPGPGRALTFLDLNFGPHCDHCRCVDWGKHYLQSHIYTEPFHCQSRPRQHVSPRSVPRDLTRSSLSRGQCPYGHLLGWRNDRQLQIRYCLP